MTGRIERIGTPKYYAIFNGSFPSPGYTVASPDNSEKLEQEIEEDFGELPEITIPYDNYYDESSPNFIDYKVVAYNREIGHALFTGFSQEADYYVEYFLEARARKAFSRRSLTFPPRRPNSIAKKVEIKYADRDYRKIYLLYLMGKGEPRINVEVTHGGDYDYDGKRLMAAYFYQGRLSTVDIIHGELVDKRGFKGMVPYPDPEFTDTNRQKRPLFAETNEPILPSPPEQYRFEPKPKSMIRMTVDSWISDFNQTIRIGGTFDPDCIKPYRICTSVTEERLRLQRIHESGAYWDFLAPLRPDTQTIRNIALAQGLGWREIDQTHLVTFNMVEPGNTLAGFESRSLPSV